MRIEEIRVYEFDELSEEAKEEAIRQTRDSPSYLSWDWWDFLVEDFATVLSLIGIKVADRTEKLQNGKTKVVTDVQFSGFYSQGDGASFTGCYEWRPDWRKELSDYAPNVESNIPIWEHAKTLAEVQRKYDNRVKASIARRPSPYVHCMTMDIDVRRYDDQDEEMLLSKEDETTVRNCMYDLALDFYQALEKEYEYFMGDEAVTEHIQANDFEFLEDGSPWS